MSNVTAVGRRKNATARVILSRGKGQITVNGQAIDSYFDRDVSVMIAMQPLELTETAGQFDIAARCDGGGKSGQAGALRHGIARALNALDAETYRGPLKAAGLLTRDSRMVERKKYGQPGARKRYQFSKR